MRKILIIVLIMVILSVSYIRCYANKVNGMDNDFTCYQVKEDVFDMFLNDMTDISIVKENSYGYAKISDHGNVFFGMIGSMDAEETGYLSKEENICRLASELGLDAEIYDYCYVDPHFDDYTEVPLTLWLNTTEGIILIVIDFCPDELEGKVNVFSKFYAKLYNCEEYRKQFGLNQATVIVNDKVVEMPYAVIRNESARLCLREVMEAAGFTVDWKQESDTIFSVSVYIPGKEGYPAKLTIDETTGYMKMESLNDGDTMEYYLHIHGNRCRLINDKVVITDTQMGMLLKLYDYTDADIDIDWKKGVINIKYIL